MPKLEFSLSITDIPEALALYRRELAQMLRDRAADEDPRVADRLREVAAIFETGQPPRIWIRPMASEPTGTMAL